MRVAAIQLEVELADVSANLAACESLAREAPREGAVAIALPEFFATGAAFLPQLAGAAIAPDGVASEMLVRVAREERVLIGGSFLCRDADGEVRNAFFLVGPDGLLGRHDKDRPTMWENALYIGASDDGLIDVGELTIGAVVCWEFMRTATARRLRGKVDLVLDGSNWWSIPPWPPGSWLLSWPSTRPLWHRRAAECDRASRPSGGPLVAECEAGELGRQSGRLPRHQVNLQASDPCLGPRSGVRD